jgi:hypothetical protein
VLVAAGLSTDATVHGAAGAATARPWVFSVGIPLLTLGAGVGIPDVSLEKRPSIPLAALVPESALATLLSTLDWWLEKARAAGRSDF